MIGSNPKHSRHKYVLFLLVSVLFLSLAHAGGIRADGGIKGVVTTSEGRPAQDATVSIVVDLNGFTVIPQQQFAGLNEIIRVNDLQAIYGRQLVGGHFGHHFQEDSGNLVLLLRVHEKDRHSYCPEQRRVLQGFIFFDPVYKRFGKQAVPSFLPGRARFPGIGYHRVGEKQGGTVHIDPFIGILQPAGARDQRYLIEIPTAIRSLPASIPGITLKCSEPALFSGMPCASACLTRA